MKKVENYQLKKYIKNVEIIYKNGITIIEFADNEIEKQNFTNKK